MTAVICINDVLGAFFLISFLLIGFLAGTFWDDIGKAGKKNDI
jgi:F0F1-type ATP synthase assembly protein I